MLLRTELWLWPKHVECVADGTHQTSKESSLTTLSNSATEACYPGEKKKSVSSDCTQEVTACFTSVFAAKSLPARFLLVQSSDMKIAEWYGGTLGRLVHIPQLHSCNQSQILLAVWESVISTSLDPLRCIQFADLQQTSTWTKLLPPDSTSISSTPGQKPYCHSGKVLKYHCCLSEGLVCTICYLRHVHTSRAW